MPSVAISLRALGGVARRSELLARGHSDGGISASMGAGQVIRPRNGWFAVAELPPPIIRAIRVGGRLGCRSALRHWGVWALDDGKLHVEVSENAARLRSPVDQRTKLSGSADGRVIVHWSGGRGGRAAADSRIAANVAEALACFSHCASREELQCAMESALNQRLISPAEARSIFGSSPELVAASESGLETLTRIRLAGHGITCTPQVVIQGIGRIDLLVGDRLAIELDGTEWHDAPKLIARDRARDAALTALGFHVLRFGFAQVVHDWPAVESAILRVIADGHHLA